MRHIAGVLDDAISNLAPAEGDPAEGLLDTLRRIEDVAARARRDLAVGGATNGRSAIRRIEEMATDGIALFGEQVA